MPSVLQSSKSSIIYGKERFFCRQAARSAVCHQTGVSEQSYYRCAGVWRSEGKPGALSKELEQENARLRRAVSNLTLRSFSLSSSQRLIS